MFVRLTVDISVDESAKQGSTLYRMGETFMAMPCDEGFLLRTPEFGKFDLKVYSDEVVKVGK